MNEKQHHCCFLLPYLFESKTREKVSFLIFLSFLENWSVDKSISATIELRSPYKYRRTFHNVYFFLKVPNHLLKDETFNFDDGFNINF